MHMHYACTCGYEVFSKRNNMFTLDVARGCTGWRKIWKPNFTGESCKWTPRQRVHPHLPEAEQKSIFLRNWRDLDGGRGYLVVLACVSRATTKKKGRRQLFRGKSAQPDKILTTRMMFTKATLRITITISVYWLVATQCEAGMF